mgnify:CR=1 FL=1
MPAQPTPKFELRVDGTIECQTSHLLGLAHVWEHVDEDEGEVEIRVQGQPIDLEPPASRLPEEPGELTARQYADRQQQWEAMIFWQNIAPTLRDNWRFLPLESPGGDVAIEGADGGQTDVLLTCAFERSALLTTGGDEGPKLITGEVIDTALAGANERVEPARETGESVWSVVFPPSVAQAPPPDEEELSVVPAELAKSALERDYDCRADRLLWISKDLRVIRQIDGSSKSSAT